jgi:predicted membrane protein
MGLRIIHLVFVACSVVLTVFFAIWAVNAYLNNQGAVYAIAALLSLAASAALVVYGMRFQKKTRNLS